MAIHSLKQLVVDEISSVDRGAGEGVRILLMKRATAIIPSPYNKSLTFGPQLSAEADAYVKREFTEDQRDAAAHRGTALPDGSFPIENKGDLKNAIQAIGRAKDPEKAKAHIKSRAEALDATDMLPEEWKKRDDSMILDFSKMRAAMTKRVPLDEALEVLKACVEGIKADDTIIDKQAAVAESVKQFHNYVAGLPAADTANMEKVMTPQEIAELVTKSVTTATAPLMAQIEKLQTEALIAALSPKAATFYKSLTDAAAKAAFLKKDKPAQDDEAEEASESDDDKKKEEAKKVAAMPVVKALTGEVEDLKKRLAKADEKEAIANFAKAATDLGLPAAHGEVMRKAFTGDADAIKKHGEMIKGLTEQVKTGKVFAEFGASGGTGVVKTAYDEIVDLAKALQKTEKVSFEVAFDKVYNDPANVELMKRSKSEEMSKRQGIAA